MGKKLYVGNLPWTFTSDDLKELFAPYGNVQSAEVISDRETGRSRGFGFVELDTQEAMEQAIRGLHETDCKGRNLTVNEARERTGWWRRGRGWPRRTWRRRLRRRRWWWLRRRRWWRPRRPGRLLSSFIPTNMPCRGGHCDRPCCLRERGCCGFRQRPIARARLLLARRLLLPPICYNDRAPVVRRA